MTSWPLWGTIVNTVAVLLGALFGLLLKVLIDKAAQKKKQKIGDGGEAASAAPVAMAELPSDKPSRFATLPSVIQKGLGLCVILIGIQGAVGTTEILIVIISMVLGIITGQLLDLDGLLGRLGAFIERKMKGVGGNVAEGFVTATMLFCVGAMTVNGALESGLQLKHDTYYAKSLIDMVSAVVFATSLGVGVSFSAVGVFLVQGTLTLLAVGLGNVIPTAVTAVMIAVGSLIVIAIGTNLMGLTKIKVMNFVPAMFFPIALCPLFDLIPML